MKLPIRSLVEVWENNFRKDTNKFIRATYLELEDLGREFKDNDGESWKILGSMDGKDMPCQRVGTNEVEVWDRWKVSELIKPEKHAKAEMNMKAGDRVTFTHINDTKKKAGKKPGRKPKDKSLSEGK